MNYPNGPFPPTGTRLLAILCAFAAGFGAVLLRFPDFAGLLRLRERCLSFRVGLLDRARWGLRVRVRPLGSMEALCDLRTLVDGALAGVRLREGTARAGDTDAALDALGDAD